MKNGYGHRYRLAPRFFFLFQGSWANGEKKTQNATCLYEAPCMFQEMRWRSYSMSVTWCKKIRKKKENLGVLLLLATVDTQKSLLLLRCYVTIIKKPLGIIRSIILLLLVFFFFYMRRSLIESMSECLRRIDGATRERKWSVVCGLASTEERSDRLLVFFL